MSSTSHRKSSVRLPSSNHLFSSKWILEIDLRNLDSRISDEIFLQTAPHDTISKVKDMIRLKRGYPLEMQRLYMQVNGVEEQELRNNIKIIELDNGYECEDELRDSETQSLPILILKLFNVGGASLDALGVINFVDKKNPKGNTLRNLMQEAQSGLAQKLRPERQLDGSSGSYILRNQFKDKVAVFKPRDEEVATPNNPRAEYVGNLGDMGLRAGFKSGEGYLREVAAYIIDSNHFHGVPHTCVCEASDDSFNYNGKRKQLKLGSFQKFVTHDTTMSDISPSLLSVDEVHKIALLDLRILNVDRNDGNILVKWVSSVDSSGGGDSRRDSDERRAKLIPIDHGYSIPDKLQIDPLDWCWYFWKQTKLPLSEATLKFIKSIDVDADAALLHNELNIDLPSLRNIRISGRLIKIAAGNGLTLFDMAELVARNEDISIPSRLELTIIEAMEKTKEDIKNQDYENMKMIVDDCSEDDYSEIRSNNSDIRRSGNDSHSCSEVDENNNNKSNNSTDSRDIVNVTDFDDDEIKEKYLTPSGVGEEVCGRRKVVTDTNDNEDEFSNNQFEKLFFCNIESLIERDIKEKCK